MFNTNTHTSQSLRFRRWSRKGYAVFCSLTCAVTIGSLAVSISDKTLQKSLISADTIFKTSPANEAEEEELDATELSATILEIQINTIQQNNSVAAAAGSKNYYSNIHQNG